MPNGIVSEKEVEVIRMVDAEAAAITDALYLSAPRISPELQRRMREFIAGINTIEDVSDQTMKGVREIAEEIEAILNDESSES